MKYAILTLFAIVLASTVNAESPATYEFESGILNPADTGREMLKRKIEMGITDSITCTMGINNTKYDNHKLAKKIARLCAEDGYVKAMTWMSHFEDNGIGGDINPEAATEWDRRAAEAGDPVGRYNYGIKLIRGRGIDRNKDLGRHYVDQAARDGLKIAKRLQEADYNLDEVTPDADNWE